MEYSQDQMNAFLIGTSQRTDLGLWTHSVTEMTGPRQVFVLLWELEQEVCNGGFSQDVHNTSGEGAPLCAQALREIGANHTATLVDQALAIVGDVSWSDDEQRQSCVEQLDELQREQLDELDQRFYQYEDNLTELLFTYVMSNIAFFPPAQGSE